MVNNTNQIFDEVYDKLVKVAMIKIESLVVFRQLGRPVNKNHVMLLNLYIRYLESIKSSKYKYFTIAGLNDISNFLNLL